MLPNAPEKNQGSSRLRRRARVAAEMTAQQRSAAKVVSEKDGVTKRKASAELVKATKEESAKKKKRRSFEFRGPTRALVIVLVVVLVLGFILYPVGRSYYKSLREQQQLEATLEAIEQRNDEIQKQNDALETQEGIEAQAREELGWVSDGEESAVVTNITEDEDSTGKLPEQVDEEKIQPPHTWYYDILDIVFFVNL